MSTTRRDLLRVATGVVTASSIAGCSSNGTGTQPSTEAPNYLYALTGSYTLPGGEFRDLPLDIDGPAEIEYTADVRSGPNIDVLVLSRGAFREFERGNAFESIESASALDTSYGDVRADLGPTDINVVFDNTTAGEASPPDTDGTVEIEFELTVRPRDS